MQLRFKALPVALFCTVCSFAVPQGIVQGQEGARVRADENFRREPNGVVLATLSAGTELQVLEQEGNWTQVVLDGWVWLQSLESTDEAGFELIVSQVDGENLRSIPSGRILAHLAEGTLLTETERNPAWARVTRTGWVWSASLELGDLPLDQTSYSTEPSPEVPAARRPGGFANVGAEGGPILTAPDGDTLALAAAGSDIEVLGRQGNWVRVKVEGWMWRPANQEGTAPEGESPSALEPADLAADPGAHAGRVVAWTVQFISLERAEAVRTDFFEGEPFLLARFDGGDGPFVYIAIPNQRLVDVEGLIPLERVSITGRVRTGASSLTGVPIVELLAIERSREDS
jgi:membrane protein implicated in regulation of membrane protease activity